MVEAGGVIPSLLSIFHYHLSITMFGIALFTIYW